MPKKIYIASSWRNMVHAKVVDMLREAGHAIFDYRNPPDFPVLPKGYPKRVWSAVDPVDPIGWEEWSIERFVEELDNPIVRQGYERDMEGLKWCDTLILLLPSGRSAHLEAGYAVGQGKELLIVLNSEDPRFAPELMYLMATRVLKDVKDIISALDDKK
jgi:hypothetical protein